MAPTAGQIYSDQSDAIEEILNKNIGFFLPSLDPFYREIFDQRSGEGNNMDIGRDMAVIKTFMGSFSGVMDQGAATQDFTLYGDGNGSADLLGATGAERMRFNNPTNAFPDPADGPNQQQFQLKVPMRSSYTSIGMTLGEMQAEAHKAHITEVINPKMMGFARMMSHTISSFLYLSQNDNYQLVKLTAGSYSTANVGGVADDTLIITPSNMAVDRFEVGMRVNIVDSSDAADVLHTTTSNPDPTFLVTRVDGLNNKVHLMHRTGGDLTSILDNAIANDDYIVHPGSRSGSNAFKGYAGLNSWIKTGDTTVSGNGDTRLLGSEADASKYIDVNAHPEFKSLGRNMNGAPLTEHELRKILRLFHRAKNKYGQSVDTMLLADGVDLAMQSQLIGREILDRTNNLATMRHQGSDNGGRPGAGMTFNFDGKTYNSYTSQFVESGAVYCTKTQNNNWKRFSPPPPKGVTKSSELSFAPFYFVGAAIGGNKSNVLPYMKTNAGGFTLPTEMSQMPGMVRMQMCPDQPAGIKLTNVQEQRLWSDN